MRHILAILFCASATAAAADFDKVDNQSAFVSLVSGKVLSRPLVRVEVLPDGRIAGTGAAWEVTGNWTWKDGYFCRQLIWGGDDLGYNCQEVSVNDGRIRFTSDMGAGDFADFRLK